MKGELDIIPIEVFKSASFLLTTVLPPSPTTWRNYDLRPSVPDERPAGFAMSPMFSAIWWLGKTGDIYQINGSDGKRYFEHGFVLWSKKRKTAMLNVILCTVAVHLLTSFSCTVHIDLLFVLSPLTREVP